MSSCQCGTNRTAPFIGFEDVRFGILVGNTDGEIADWTVNPRIIQRGVPGRNGTVVQHLGFDPGTVTWTLYFDCAHQFNALYALQGTIGTLTIIEGVQLCKGTQITINGKVYEKLPNTLLLNLDQPVRELGSGGIEAQATFQRAIDPVTRLEVVP